MKPTVGLARHGDVFVVTGFVVSVLSGDQHKWRLKAGAAWRCLQLRCCRVSLSLSLLWEAPTRDGERTELLLPHDPRCCGRAEVKGSKRTRYQRRASYKTLQFPRLDEQTCVRTEERSFSWCQHQWDWASCILVAGFLGTFEKSICGGHV